MEQQDSTSQIELQLFRTHVQRLETYFLGLESAEKMRCLSSLVRLVDSQIRKKSHILFDYKEARRVRESEGLTLRELANQLGIKSPQTIGNYERGFSNPYDSDRSGAINYSRWLEQAKKPKSQS